MRCGGVLRRLAAVMGAPVWFIFVGLVWARELVGRGWIALSGDWDIPLTPEGVLAWSSDYGAGWSRRDLGSLLSYNTDLPTRFMVGLPAHLGATGAVITQGLVILCVATSGWLSYGLLRTLTRKGLPALTGGTVYALSPLFVNGAVNGYPSFILAATALPGLLWAVVILSRSPSFRLDAALSASIAGVVVSAHAPLIPVTLLAVVLTVLICSYPQSVLVATRRLLVPFALTAMAFVVLWMPALAGRSTLGATLDSKRGSFVQGQVPDLWAALAGTWSVLDKTSVSGVLRVVFAGSVAITLSATLWVLIRYLWRGNRQSPLLRSSLLALALAGIGLVWATGGGPGAPIHRLFADTPIGVLLRNVNYVQTSVALGTALAIACVTSFLLGRRTTEPRAVAVMLTAIALLPGATLMGMGAVGKGLRPIPAYSAPQAEAAAWAQSSWRWIRWPMPQPIQHEAGGVAGIDSTTGNVDMPTFPEDSPSGRMLERLLAAVSEDDRAALRLLEVLGIRRAISDSHVHSVWSSYLPVCQSHVLRSREARHQSDLARIATTRTRVDGLTRLGFGPPSRQMIQSGRHMVVNTGPVAGGELDLPSGWTAATRASLNLGFPVSTGETRLSRILDFLPSTVAWAGQGVRAGNACTGWTTGSGISWLDLRTSAAGSTAVTMNGGRFVVDLPQDEAAIPRDAWVIVEALKSPGGAPLTLTLMDARARTVGSATMDTRREGPMGFVTHAIRVAPRANGTLKLIVTSASGRQAIARVALTSQRQIRATAFDIRTAERRYGSVLAINQLPDVPRRYFIGSAGRFKATRLDAGGGTLTVGGVTVANGSEVDLPSGSTTVTVSSTESTRTTASDFLETPIHLIGPELRGRDAPTRLRPDLGPPVDDPRAGIRLIRLPSLADPRVGRVELRACALGQGAILDTRVHDGDGRLVAHDFKKLRRCSGGGNTITSLRFGPVKGTNAVEMRALGNIQIVRGTARFESPPARWILTSNRARPRDTAVTVLREDSRWLLTCAGTMREPPAFEANGYAQAWRLTAPCERPAVRIQGQVLFVAGVWTSRLALPVLILALGIVLAWRRLGK